VYWGGLQLAEGVELAESKINIEHSLVQYQIMIMELGSPHDSIVEVAKIGVLQALEHNMLPKPILQEALRCVRVRVPPTPPPLPRPTTTHTKSSHHLASALLPISPHFIHAHTYANSTMFVL
jgi:hypothetical protein